MMRVEIEVTEDEHAKLASLGREMNGRTPAEIARGIVGAYLEKIPSHRGRKRSNSSCAAAMLLAYKLWKERSKVFTYKALARAYKNQWPVHAIRARLSTLRAAGELNYRPLGGGVFMFTDV